MSAPSDRELEIMRHTLGVESAHPGYRNYYCASADDKTLISMAERGLMIAGRLASEGTQRYYSVAPEWCKVMGIKVQR